MPGRRWLDALAVEGRVLLVQQCVELAFPLLPQADAPTARADRMHNERLWHMGHAKTFLQEREVQVGVLAPGGREALIEAADRCQRSVAAESVRGGEFRRLQARFVALVISRRPRQRHANLPP